MTDRASRSRTDGSCIRGLNRLLGGLLLVAISGCAGSSGVSQAAYVREVNAACREGRTEPPEPTAPAIEQSVLSAIEHEVTAARRIMEDVEAIKPPKDDASEIESAFIGPMQARIRKLEGLLPELSKAIAAEDADRINTLGEELGRAPSISDFATSYGLTECSDLAAI